jgi:hypothetical protein
MLAAKMQQGADKAVAALSVIVGAARPMAVASKELEHEIEQLHRFFDVRLGMVLTAPDPENELKVSRAP